MTTGSRHCQQNYLDFSTAVSAGGVTAETALVSRLAFFNYAIIILGMITDHLKTSVERKSK